MKNSCVFIALMFFVSVSNAQVSYYSINDNSTITPLVPSATLGSNAQTISNIPLNNSAGTTIRTITASFANQAFPSPIYSGNANASLNQPMPSGYTYNAGLMFGASTTEKLNVKRYSKQNYVAPMDIVGAPQASFYDPAGGLIGDLDPAVTYSTNILATVEGVSKKNFDTYSSNDVPTTSRIYLGNINYTFDKPVDYPILHITGLGGFFGYIGSDNNQYELIYSVELISNYNLTKLSGTTHTVLSNNNTIQNNFEYLDVLVDPSTTTYGTSGDEAGSGSFRVMQTGVTTVTLQVWVQGKPLAGTETSVQQYWSARYMQGNQPATATQYDTVPFLHNKQNWGGDQFDVSWTLPAYTFTGSVVVDKTNDNIVNGTAYTSSSPNYTATYATLVDANGNVVQSVLVNPATGAFGFTEVLGDNYSVILTPNQLTPGDTAPTSGTPPNTYVSTGQAFGTSNAQDGSPVNTKTDSYAINYSSLNSTTTPTLIFGITKTYDISGTVFNDNNAGIPNGTHNDYGTLYAVLVNPDGSIKQYATVDPTTGAYSITGVPEGDYTVVITNSPTSKVSQLNGNFQNVGSASGTGNSVTDATLTDGAIPIKVSGSNITGINFGINEPPTTYNKLNDVINNASSMTSPVALSVNIGSPASNDPAPSDKLSSTDPNNGIPQYYTIDALPLYGDLYLNGVKVTNLDQVSNLTSADLSKLSYQTDLTKPNAISQTQDLFTYHVTDEAGLKSVPSTYVIPFAGPLPVTLINFGAAADGCAARLDWKVGAEDNFSRYDIERSENGNNFVKVGVRGAQGSNSNYTYVDANPLKGENYYRLKMVDLDGTFKYSNISKVAIDCQGPLKMITMNPTLTTTITRLNGLKKGEGILVANSAGQVLQNLRATGEMLQINLAAYPAGIYNVVVRDGNKVVFSGKVVKQ